MPHVSASIYLSPYPCSSHIRAYVYRNFLMCMPYAVHVCIHVHVYVDVDVGSRCCIFLMLTHCMSGLSVLCLQTGFIADVLLKRAERGPVLWNFLLSFRMQFFQIFQVCRWALEEKSRRACPNKNISFSELRFACFEHSDWLLKSLQPIRALKASVASFCGGDYLNIMGPWEAWIKNCHCTLLH